MGTEDIMFREIDWGGGYKETKTYGRKEGCYKASK